MEMTRREWLTIAGVAAAAVAGGEPPEVTTKAGDMALIPAGPFLMGTAQDECAELAREYGYHVSWLSGEYPQRQMDLPAFYIDKFPVTNEQFHQFCVDTKYAPRVHWHGEAPPEPLLRHPVVSVNKADAMAYAAWAGKRLPTEAEWEKAARGADGRRFPWGNRFLPHACQWQSAHAGRSADPGTVPVDSYPDGASPYRVMDMAGNAAEWCSDGPGPGNAFIKGGCWLTTQPINLRPAARNMSGNEANASAFYGFRCAQDA